MYVVSAKVKDEVKGKGLFKKLQAVCEDLTNENSDLYKKVSKIKRGVQTAQNIAKQYNKIAHMFGIPAAPELLLNIGNT